MKQPLNVVYITKGDTRNVTAEITTEYGLPTNLQGSTIQLAIYSDIGQSVVVSGVLSDEFMNQATFDIPASVYNRPGDYKMQVSISKDGNTRILPSDGNFGHLIVAQSLFP